MTQAMTISAQHAYRAMAEDERITLLDVRSAAEYEVSHSQDASLLPLDVFHTGYIQSALQNILKHQDKPIFVTCQSSRRATRAAEQLLAMGYQDVLVV